MGAASAPFHPSQLSPNVWFDADDNALIASWMNAFNKECNFLWSGRPYIIKKTHPKARGAVHATDFVPAASSISPDNAAGAYAADNALVSKPTTFQVIWGAKKYPQNEVKNAELTYHQKMMQGIEVYREGAGQAPSADTTRCIFGMNLEKVSGDLDGMGASSRSGEGIQVVISNAGTEDGSIIASKAYCLLTYTSKIELRTGSVRQQD